MNRFSGNKVFIILYGAGMLLAMLRSPIWYVNLVLVGLMLETWYFSGTRRELIPAYLICGEISCAVAWYASPWFSWIIQIAVFGLLYTGLDIPDSRKERISLLFLSCALAGVTVVCDWINHTDVLVVIIMGASVLALLYILVVEFRIRREYAGEKS